MLDLTGGSEQAINLPRQSQTDLPVRLWHSGKGMDRIRISMNPVNCLFHLPSLSFTPRTFYLCIWIFCPKCLSPCLDINPKNCSFSHLKSVLALWASGAMRKYWCLLPLKMPAGKKLPIGLEFQLWNPVFLPSSIFPYRTIWMYTHTHKSTHYFNASPCLPLTCVIVRSWAVTSQWHTTKLGGGEFISEAIAHRASHLSPALAPSVGQDLPSVIGSFFIPKHSSSLPHNPLALSEMSSG